MKRIRYSIRIRSMFVKFFVSFVILLAVFTLAISTSLYQAFSKSSAKQINEIALKGLEQSRSIVEFMMNQAKLITLQLSLDPDIILSINSPGAEADYFLTGAALRKVNDILLTNKNIYSITLYNGQSNSLIGNDRDRANAEQSFIQLLQQEELPSLGRVIPRTLAVTRGLQILEEKVYTTYYYEREANHNQIANAIIVNVKLNEVVKTNEKTAEKSLFIVDKKGNTVYETAQTGLLNSFNEHADHWNNALGSDDNSFIIESEGQRMLAAFTYSEQLGWYFVSMLPYATAMAPITEVRYSVMLTCLLLLIAAFIVAAVLSGMLSSPFARLARRIRGYELAQGGNQQKQSEMEVLTRFYSTITSQYEELKASRDLSRVSMKMNYLKELLQGIRVPEQGDEKQYGLSFSVLAMNSLSIAVIKLDQIKELSEQGVEVDQTISTVLFNFAERFLQEQVDCELVQLEHEIVVISGENSSRHNDLPLQSLQSPSLQQAHQPDQSFQSDQFDQSELLTSLFSLQQEIYRIYQLTVTIGAGQVKNNVHDLGEAYLTAKEAVLYRLAEGEGKLLVYDEIMKRINEAFEYSYSSQRDFLEAIKAGKAEKAEEMLKTIFESFRLAPYHMIRLSIHHLLFALVTADVGYHSSPVSSGSFAEMLGRLEKMESLDAILAWFVNYSNDAVASVIANKESSKTELAQEIALFLEEQYGNPELSVEMTAERFHYNAIYFGRLFKELFHCLFLEYVTALRVKKTNQFLRETKLTVKEIGTQVGFLNSSYFVTWYKKNTGLAPTEYRKQQQALSQ